MGHRKGADRLYEILMASLEVGVKVLTVYAFSVENWKRPQAEVDYLMTEATNFLKKHESDIISKEIRVIVIGEDDRIPDYLREKKYYYMDLTKDYNKMTFVIALNYGSHQELVQMVKKISEKVKTTELTLMILMNKQWKKTYILKELPL